MSRGEHFCKSHVKKSSVPLAILERAAENWPDGVEIMCQLDSFMHLMCSNADLIFPECSKITLHPVEETLKIFVTVLTCRWNRCDFWIVLATNPHTALCT